MLLLVSDIWDQGIGTGVVILLCTTLVGLLWYVVRTALTGARIDSTVIKTAIVESTAAVQLNQFTTLQTLLTGIGVSHAAEAKLREDRYQQVNENILAELQLLNTHFSELTGALNVVLNNYVNSNPVVITPAPVEPVKEV